MGYQLNALFISSKKKLSDEALLKKIGYKGKLSKKGSVEFFETNKRWNRLFVGAVEGCSIVCNGKLINRAFEEENFAAELPEAEIGAIIWDEAGNSFGFVLFQDGRLLRKVLVSAGEFEFDFGQPIEEELNIKEEDLFEAEERAEIIAEEGEAQFKKMLSAERTCHATNQFVARYVGAELVGIEEDIEMEDYG